MTPGLSRPLAFLPAALRIAWRDLASSRARFALPLLAMAAGVACLGGTQGAGNVFDRFTRTNLREWIAADLSIMTAEELDPHQTAVLAELQRRGIESTVVIESASQVTSDLAPDPQPAMARAVDPSRYPFYGKVQLSSNLPAESVLDANSVAVSEDLLYRLETAVGSRIEVNHAPFTVVATIRSLPDQLTVPPAPLPRLLMSHQAAARAGLMNLRGLHYERILLRLPRVEELTSVRQSLEAAFPGRKILDFREPDPQIAAITATTVAYLRSISLIALLVGVLGVAVAMWSHLERRLDSIAIKKMLGATSRQLLAIYWFQTLLLAAASCAVGLVCALALERIVAGALSRLISRQITDPWDWRGPLSGAAIGMVAANLVLGPILLKIRSVRPYSMLRRAVRLQHEDAFYGQPLVLSLFVLFLLVAAIQGGWRTALALVAGLAAFATVIGALTAIALGALRRITRSVRGLPATLRYGIENLLRPGNHARAGIAAMSAAFALLFAVYLVAQAVVQDVMEHFPPASARLVLLNIQPDQVDGLTRLLSSQPGVTDPPLILPTFNARIVAVDGVPIDELPGAESTGLSRRWLSARVEPVPPTIELAQGAWWAPGEPRLLASLPHRAARSLPAHLGSRIDFEAAGVRFTAHLAALHRVGPLDRFRCCFLFNAAVPVRQNLTHYGMVAVTPDASSTVRRNLYRQFPGVTTFDGALSLDLMERWLDSIFWTVRLLAALTMAAAAVLLGSIVAATFTWRAPEIAVWRTLGARTRRIVLTHLIEFSAIGLAAGLIGTLLASCTVTPVWAWFTDNPPQWPAPAAMIVAIAAVVLIANLAGWLAVWRFIGQKPMATLRES